MVYVRYLELPFHPTFVPESSLLQSAKQCKRLKPRSLARSTGFTTIKLEPITRKFTDLDIVDWPNSTLRFLPRCTFLNNGPVQHPQHVIHIFHLLQEKNYYLPRGNEREFCDRCSRGWNTSSEFTPQAIMWTGHPTGGFRDINEGSFYPDCASRYRRT